MAWDWLEIFPDLFKREVKTETESEIESIFHRLDVDQFFQYLNNYWNPGELISKIGGYQNLHLLYKDSEIYAAIDKRIAALEDTRLVIEGDDKALVKFMEEQILPHESQLKKDFWWTVFNGFGVEQIIYDPDRSCKVVGFQREDFWRFQPLPDLLHAKVVYTGNYKLMNKVLPYGKWVVTTNNGSYSNPMGDAMAERLIQPWIFRCTGWDLWIDFAKRFANGFMHAQINDMKQATDFRIQLEKAGKSSIVVTDKATTLNMIQASRDSNIYTEIDNKTVASMQKVILGETLTSDMAVRGSSGAAQVHEEVRYEKTWADIRLVEKALNETMRQIAGVCGYAPDAKIPTAKLIFDPGLNAELAGRDAVLATSGVKFTKKYYVNNYGLKEDEFEIVEPSPQSFFSQKKSLFLSDKQKMEFVGVLPTEHVCSSRVDMDANIARKDTRQLNEKEDAVAFLNRNASPPIAVEDIFAAISLSKNKKELDANLNALFDNRSTDFEDWLTETLLYVGSKGALLGNPEKLPDETE